MSSSLARARKELQKRLARRGVTLSLAVCALELGRAGAKAVAPALLRATLEAGLSLVAGEPVLMTLVSAQVSALVKGTIQMMLTTKFELATFILFAVGLLAGAGLLAVRVPAAPPAGDKPPPQAPAAADAKKPGRTDHFGDPLPEGAIARLGTVRFRHSLPGGAGWPGPRNGFSGPDLHTGRQKAPVGRRQRAPFGTPGHREGTGAPLSGPKHHNPLRLP